MTAAITTLLPGMQTTGTHGTINQKDSYEKSMRAALTLARLKLNSVVNQYDGQLNPGLTGAEKADLVEYLKSL